MQIDVFTLFPAWFEWFRGQRRVAMAVGGGRSRKPVACGATAPRSGGQVDATPFGGGGGMVLRVAVVDVALGARYGGSGAPGGVVALPPRGRLRDEPLVRE